MRNDETPVCEIRDATTIGFEVVVTADYIYHIAGKLTYSSLQGTREISF